ncbi:hypothetical protein OsJ_34168 [Oryza sativa Japonica Group]|uniref:Uncharacterized protein n=1 Tax=Oryza sativa subsp. japonica TaxID=39947 RepID=A3CC36_ORYSJ|nr:hypothetical protein OsJ_34168 [Oryza sativa Japonica Group]
MVRYVLRRPLLKPSTKRMLLMVSSLLMSSSCGGSDKPAAVSSLVRELEAVSSGGAERRLGRSAEAELARRQLEWQQRWSSREGGDKPAAISNSLHDSTSPFTLTAAVAPSVLPETGGHRVSHPQAPPLLPVLLELGGLRAPVSSLASLSTRLLSGGLEELGAINPNDGNVVLLVGGAGGGEDVDTRFVPDKQRKRCQCDHFDVIKSGHRSIDLSIICSRSNGCVCGQLPGIDGGLMGDLHTPVNSNG